MKTMLKVLVVVCLVIAPLLVAPIFRVAEAAPGALDPATCGVDVASLDLMADLSGSANVAPGTRLYFYTDQVLIGCADVAPNNQYMTIIRGNASTEGKEISVRVGSKDGDGYLAQADDRFDLQPPPFNSGTMKYAWVWRKLNVLIEWSQPAMVGTTTHIWMWDLGPVYCDTVEYYARPVDQPNFRFPVQSQWTYEFTEPGPHQFQIASMCFANDGYPQRSIDTITIDVNGQPELDYLSFLPFLRK